MDKYTAANIVVDIMEMKAGLMKPRSMGQEQDLGELFKYSMFEAIISKLIDKYSIRGGEIEAVLTERAAQKRFGGSKEDNCYLDYDEDGTLVCTRSHKIGEHCLMHERDNND